MIVDIHAHTTLRAINTPGSDIGHNPWANTENLVQNTIASRWARMQSREIAKYSQANLEKVHAAGVRVLFDSLYPVEKGFLNFRRFPNLIVSAKNRDEAMVTALGIEPQRLRTLRNRADYFPELLEQYTFISKNQGKQKGEKRNYFLAKDFSHLQSELKKNEQNLALVLTIEGAHAFGTGCPSTKGKSIGELKERLAENITTVKSWESPPFLVNLAHHFWNQLCGHAKSFKPPIHMIFDQGSGMNRGITELGWFAIEEMLSTGNGRRMLVDIKHMSLKSRMEYYEFIRRQNHISPERKIPVVCSHTGISGLSNFREQQKSKDTSSALRKSKFNAWSINLNEEELRFIAGTGGLVGIMMDKAMLCSLKELDRIKTLKNESDRKHAFVSIIGENILKMIKAVGQDAWNMICLGTDYDGLITHFDCYPDASYLPMLMEDLEAYFHSHKSKPEFSFGLRPKEMVDRIFHKNAMRFLKRHFKA